MSDSDAPKKAEIPAWQTAAATKSVKVDEIPARQEPESRETIIAQARKFLEEDEVRDTSTDKKVAFLEGKGLRNEEIQQLLGITRNTEASSTIEVCLLPLTMNSTDLTWTREAPPTHSPSPSQASPPPPQPAYSPPQYQAPSQPPIITYPEFLTTPVHPTPLITKPRLLTTLYAFSGLSALLYGTHTYLITPMIASLTESRLSFASTSKTNLEKLITQLESLVSEIPPNARDNPYADNESESDEDPTEMFHRDIGIQTSPDFSRPTSPLEEESPISAHISSLVRLKMSLDSLMEDSSSEGVETAELEGTMGILREFLDGMAYVQPTYNYGVGGYGARSAKDEDDEIGRVKKEIRGVKGVLLSARSFPGGARVAR